MEIAGISFGSLLGMVVFGGIAIAFLYRAFTGGQKGGASADTSLDGSFGGPDSDAGGDGGGDGGGGDGD